MTLLRMNCAKIVTKNLFLLTLLSLLLTTLYAQRPATLPGRQSFRPEPSVKSPEVASDGRVTFRLRSPEAKQAIVTMAGAAPLAMQKNEKGVWSATTEALSPDVYPYSFVVDSVTVPDPSNPSMKPIYQIGLGQSLVHVPGPATLSWEVNDVPRGSITHHFYKSGIIGDQRDFYVYTPPGYDPTRKKPYPVLYLFHGITDDASAWTTAGRANIILDNLIASGKAEPMLMVNTLGYGAPELLANGFGGMTPALMQKNTTQFAQALLDEVIPMVEKTYRAAKDRDFRAIAGLSMGGAQALFTGLNHLDQFAYIGGFSSAVVMLNPDYSQSFPTLNATVNTQARLIWMSCGTDDFLIDANRKFKDWVTTKGVQLKYVEMPGAHTWMVWRRNLTDFAPQLFKSNTQALKASK